MTKAYKKAQLHRLLSNEATWRRVQEACGMTLAVATAAPAAPAAPAPTPVHGDAVMVDAWLTHLSLVRFEYFCNCTNAIRFGVIEFEVKTS